MLVQTTALSSHRTMSSHVHAHGHALHRRRYATGECSFLCSLGNIAHSHHAPVARRQHKQTPDVAAECRELEEQSERSGSEDVTKRSTQAEKCAALLFLPTFGSGERSPRGCSASHEPIMKPQLQISLFWFDYQLWCKNPDETRRQTRRWRCSVLAEVLF